MSKRTQKSKLLNIMNVKNELMKLAWDTQELSSINETGRHLQVESTVLQEKLQDNNDYDNFIIVEKCKTKLKAFFRRSTRIDDKLPLMLLL